MRIYICYGQIYKGFLYIYRQVIIDWKNVSCLSFVNFYTLQLVMSAVVYS